jgi:hypothetical protein
LRSISMVTELAGMTLPQTTTFNVHFLLNQPSDELQRRLTDAVGAFVIQTPLPLD